jgi:transketolase
MVHTAVEAAKSLQLENISARVVNMHTVKPIDTEIITNAAKETKAIITLEEHQAIGGLGSAVAEVLSEYHPTKMRIIGVNDEFGETGTLEELFKSKGLTVERVEKEVKELL